MLLFVKEALLRVLSFLAVISGLEVAIWGSLMLSRFKIFSEPRTTSPHPASQGTQSLKSHMPTIGTVLQGHVL
eukprot:2148391-Amphidinium_carterae.1